MMKNKCLDVFLISLLGLVSCTFPAGQPDSATVTPPEVMPVKTTTLPPQPAASLIPIELPTLQSLQSLGPHNYPQDVNPLNGLPVSNPENLKYPPLLVSISNFPPTARPQAGLSYCPIIFEMWIGDGMTRLLGIFYGDFPQQLAEPYPLDDTQTTIPEASVGPIRSGRLPYEYVRQLFSGYLVMASASQVVADQLSDYSNIFGSDLSDPNSAMMEVTQLEALAQSGQKEVGEATLRGMYFDTRVPEGGKPAHSVWLFYSYLNQIFWRYAESGGTFQRWQDNADATNFIQATDRLTGEPLQTSNVIILFADHDVKSATVIDISLLYIKRGQALLFRDGQKYDIYWTTASEEYEKTTGKLRPIRFVDAEGNPFPLKPGQTWIEIVPFYTPYWETVDSEIYNRLVYGDQPGSGFWAVRVHAPK
ncbi:MAG: DUF3048 domain-containing protein [Chloroflexi bacterium]|nr:DUF3048 domain-containing protein [Chloroflexota bacterium]